MSEAPANPLSRAAAIRADRARSRLRALASSAVIGLLLFGSFAIGAGFGPAPLRPVELAAGFGGALLLGLLAGVPLGARRVRRGAIFSAQLREGRRTVPATVFRDHLLLGDEIVLSELVSRAEIDRDVLVLRYQDLRSNGPVLRELGGPPGALARLVELLARPAAAPGDGA